MAKGTKENNPVEQTVKRVKGGPQPGSGRPAGQLGLKARTALEIKARIAQKADQLLNAELVHALGAFIVMKADPENPLSYERVTDESEIVRFIQEYGGANGQMDGQVYVLMAKPGDSKSRQYLFDRAFGRPPQAVEIIEDPEIVRLKASIELRAREKGTTFNDELRNYIESYAPPAIKERLSSELIQ